MELASTTGKGRKMTELTIAKRTTFAAMQTEKVSSTVATKPLSCHKERNPYFRSRRNASIVWAPAENVLASLKTNSRLEGGTQRRGIKFQVDGFRAPAFPWPSCAPYPTRLAMPTRCML